MAWLEREVQSLQAALERQPYRQMSDYWQAGPPPAPPLPPSEGRRKGEEQEEEALRSVPIVFPKLPEASSSTAGLEAGDWIAQLAPLVGDISHRAATWWSRVLARCMGLYKVWLEASPLERLHMEIPAVEEVSPGQLRLDQRVTALLLAALPEALKEELIANRQLHTAAILLRVLKAYQPGGQAEKAATLSALTATTPASTPVEAVKALRLWHRQATRAKELGVVLPDATLRVKALDKIMTTLLAQDSQCNFRVSAFRMNYGVDIKPTESSVSYLYDLLLSEAEQLMYGESLAKPSGVIESPQKPSVKMMATPSKGNGGKCKAWGTPTGCRFGKACKFAHDDLPDKADRCWICSSVYHRKAECPHKGDTTHGAPGGGGESSKDPDGAGNAGSGKAKGKGKEKGKMKEKGSPGQAQQSAEGAQKSDDKETASVKKVETTGEETSAKEIGSLVSEATSLLRSLRLGTDRQVKVCVVKRLQTGEAPLTLLDGGGHAWASTSSESR